MKLELLDTYHIRVRLSASIIVLAPLAITIFLCFPEIATLASSNCCPSGIYELPPNCAEADLPKKSSVQKLCSTVSHAR